MGNILNLISSETRSSGPCEVLQGDACKRQMLLSSSCEGNSRLIPSLPDDISIQIIARVPRIHYSNLKLVSRGWKAVVGSSELYCVRKKLGTAEEWLYILTKVENDMFLWLALDPLSGRWQRLPPMPKVRFENERKKGMAGCPLQMWKKMGSSVKTADFIMTWFEKRDALDKMPFCGFSIGAVNGCIFAVGGFSRASAMKSVWQYDPVKNSWTEATPMLVARAYCKTGVLNNKLYVVGGVTRGRGELSPIQSAEVYDPLTGIWSQLPNMPFTKPQALRTAFLPDSDLFKPIATGVTSYKGRLFVPQSLYCWPCFVDVGGEVYDPNINSWLEMPIGMGEGWPARQTGTKLSITVDDNLYALDLSNSLDNEYHNITELQTTALQVYDNEGDTWRVTAGDVPICDSTDSESPYLLAALLGKLHIITKDTNHNITVLQADKQNDLAISQSVLSSPDNSSSEHAESSAETDTEIWRVLATRSGRSAELVSCQSLKI